MLFFFSFLFVRIFTFREANLAKRKRCMETRGCEKTGIAQGSGNWAKNRVWHWSVNVERSKGTCLEKKEKNKNQGLPNGVVPPPLHMSLLWVGQPSHILRATATWWWEQGHHGHNTAWNWVLPMGSRHAVCDVWGCSSYTAITAVTMVIKQL